MTEDTFDAAQWPSRRTDLPAVLDIMSAHEQ